MFKKYICRKVFFKLKNVLNGSSKMMLVESLILVHFNFCNQVHGHILRKMISIDYKKEHNNSMRFNFAFLYRQNVTPCI